MTDLVSDLLTTSIPVSTETYGDVRNSLSSNRFIAELVIIILSVVANSLGLAAVILTHVKSKSVYHILYVNVSVSNILACTLTWFCGNLPFFFSDWFSQNYQKEQELYCQATVYKQMSLVIALSVGIQMNISMLSLALSQYFAICRPLQSMYLLQKKRAYFLIILAVVLFFVCACVPFTVLMLHVRNNECTEELINTVILRDVRVTANTYTAFIMLIYVFMIAVGVRIYYEIHNFSARTRRMSRRKSINVDEKKLKKDQRAYLATYILLVSRTLFTIPLTIYFVVNINLNGFQKNEYVHYLTILPCAKCILDPIIYGSIMRDVRRTWMRFSTRCLGGDYGSESTRLTHSTSTTSETSRGSYLNEKRNSEKKNALILNPSEFEKGKDFNAKL